MSVSVEKAVSGSRRSSMGGISKAYRVLLYGINGLGALWLVGLLILICTDVTFRGLFNAPVPGVPEIAKLSVVGIVWMMMPYTLMTEGHLRSNLILDRLPPRGRALANGVTYLAGLVIFGLIAYASWTPMVDAWQFGHFEGERPVRVPTAPIHTMVLVGAALMALQCGISLCRNVGIACGWLDREDR